jgi:predicted glycosyltransferase
MPDVWLDAVTPKDSLLIYSLLPSLKAKGYQTLVTAKKQTQTTDILDLLSIDYTLVGEYGETLREKLAVESTRTLQFIDLFDKTGLPSVLWTHGDVGAIRTAFGLQIPIIYCNDTPHALHVARLVSPLVDWLIAPVAFGKSWSKFGIAKSRIVLYDGVEEAAWLQNPTYPQPEFLKELPKKGPVVLFRNAEYKAAYCKNVKVDPWKLLEKLSEIATVVYLPRYEEEKDKLKNLNNVWTPPKPVLATQIIPYTALMIGSGGTICRETALSGVPTINFHFWDAVARYLYRKGFPIRLVRNTEKIMKIARETLQKPSRDRAKDARRLKELENPVPIAAHYVEQSIKSKTD